jgi:hypothetical protein
MGELETYVIENPNFPDLPEIERTWIHDTETDEIFIPGSELCFIAAASAGVQTVRRKGKRFYPLSLVKRLHPEMDYDSIEAKLRAAIEAEGAEHGKS